MLKSVVFYGLSVIALASSAAAQADICDTYVVTPGDTLRIIAEQYYGDRALSPIIYDANTGVIGPNPNLIELGMTLSIPCRADMSPAQPTALMATTGSTDTTGTPDSNNGFFVAVSGDTPFMDSEGTGIVPELVAMALRIAGFETEPEIIRAASTDDVLQQATQPGALLSFPWIKPDCADPTLLSERSQNLCQNYVFSEPVYPVTLGLFARAGDPVVNALTTDDLSGRSVCIPGFHSEDILRKNAILEMDLAISYADNIGTCLAGLADKSVDLIVADYQSYSVSGPEYDGVVDIPAFAEKTTLHAIASIQNPEALDLIKLANSGIGNMLESGIWFEIVKAHMAGQPHVAL